MPFPARRTPQVDPRDAATALRRRSRNSQLLHTLDAWAARPWLVVLLVAADALWLALSVYSGFPDRPEAVFHTVVDALTVGLVFVLQHTQAREQVAVQRKLDEILQALPGTEKSLVTLEEGSDDELRLAALRHRSVRRTAGGGPLPEHRGGRRRHTGPAGRRLRRG